MDVTAPCIRLSAVGLNRIFVTRGSLVSSVMTLMILLCAHDPDAVSLLVVPNRLQFLEYESVTFHCEGVDYCEVVQKYKGKVKSCNKTNERTPTGSSCTIKNVYTDDSGEYWYETGGRTRSNIIILSVTAGPVILESPAVPVLMEETVTLSCRNKTASSNLTADFYKDGRLIYQSSTGNIAIHRVSKSDEGLYKCSISGAGESPQSWLKVTDMTHSSSAATPWIIATILVSALLVTVGLHHFGKGYWKRAGPVILESPAVPVLMEETVTLSCRNKITPSSLTADFYKDGRLIYQSSTGNMTIQRVSKSDEGLYKCSISGAGESPESWLKVTDMTLSSSAATPWIIATILVSALLVTVGLHHFGKGYWKREACTVDAGGATYAFVAERDD
ncbi:low affinity immunoglobulin gamma Fc region receptor III-like [Neolamprologus brichardi]|uniref:low affinity immunoglobulin gamma Fc region receptor III-like n=1 Tax=Neolamprologus brichardi TaxID=32507 RepID=UPI0016438AE8|nr:low affinity immunoglobulin gamma Fc region receptor III-like [Neolamprologus brichardi]